MSSSSSSHRQRRPSPPISPSPSPNPPPRELDDRSYSQHSPMALRVVQQSPVGHHPPGPPIAAYPPQQHHHHHPPPMMHSSQVPPPHHPQYPPYPPPNASQDMSIGIPSHSASHLPQAEHPVHHHQSHPYAQSSTDMSHPYSSPYPILPAPHVPARNGGVGSGVAPGKDTNRKRKKADSPDDQQQQPPARRLRRLHEACTRCRTKKIKCDSKLPSCSACTAAHVECNQEDRHRQTLKPRGYTDRLETTLVKCILVLQQLVPGFEASPDVDGLFERHHLSLDVDNNAVIANVLAASTGNTVGQGAMPVAMKQEPHANPLAISVDISSSQSKRDAPPSPIAPMRVPDNQSSGPSGVRGRASTIGQSASPANENVRGQDPQSNDLSGLPGLIKAFGVNKDIVRDLPRPDSNDSEDVLGGVRMEDDEPVPRYPKTVSQWTTRPLVRRAQVPTTSASAVVQTPGTYLHPSSPSHTLGGGVQNPRKLAFRLPKDRHLTERVVSKYFESLNPHRPVFFMEEFNWGLKVLYDSLDAPGGPSATPPYGRSSGLRLWEPHLGPLASVSKHPADDPGFLCSVYLILALGRLSEDNEHLHAGKLGLPEELKDYPTHEEFFELALAVKPDLRVTISSLQALILLQWYLYTERHGRTLWRLVGNLVRLSVELGLHHDPSEQQNTFTPGEAEVRNRLWWIVMIHDRGTSVLLGRPLAIAEADFNTPLPRRNPNKCFSPELTHGFTEHFEHSPDLTTIQGDIINALYRPGNHKQSADQIVRHASRITRSFYSFTRNKLPMQYRRFFESQNHLSMEQRIAIVANMNENEGLTLLKYGIARILLLRAIFTNIAVNPEVRRQALSDAVVTSHNILTIQLQLTCFPSLSFFISPIPMHIAAMTIIYAVISKCDVLPIARAKEDVCSALHIGLLFRWRWLRKDSHGSHPLIVNLAQKVFGSELLNVQGPLGPPMLMPELDWTNGMGESAQSSSLSPSRDGLRLGSGRHYPNGHRQSDMRSPVSAGGPGHWDPQNQQVAMRGGPTRQSTDMAHNGALVTSPHGQHAPHGSRDGYGQSQHMHHNSAPPGYDPSTSGAPNHTNYSPNSDGSPPSYQVSDQDRNLVEAFLYPPPLTNEEQIPGVSTAPMGVGLDPYSMAQPVPVQPQGQQLHGAYDVQQQQHIQPPNPQQHLPQQIPPNHPVPHNNAVHSASGHQLYQGGMQQMPVHQGVPTIVSDYAPSAAYYLQEEFDQSIPAADGLPAQHQHQHQQNGMWTS